MLRGLVLLLVLANGGFFLWSQGHLAAYGLAPQTQREPERLQQQVTPEVLRLLDPPGAAVEAPPATAPPDGLAAVTAPTDSPAQTATHSPEPALTPADPAIRPPAAAAMAPPAVSLPAAVPPSTGRNAALQVRGCWEAHGFTEAQGDSLRTSLGSLDLPAGSWQLSEQRRAGRWLVYLGRFENTAQLERKQAELRSLQVQAKPVSTPGLKPGLSLGSYPTEDAARQALQRAVRSGVRTAQVAQEWAESVSVSLRLPSALPVERSAVTDLGDALAGKTLQACN